MPVNSNPVPKPTSHRLVLFTWLAAFWVSALAVPASLGQDAPAAKPRGVRSQETVEGRRVSATPAAVLDILVIQPFRLQVGYDFNWLQSRPFVSDGLLVVLRVDPSYVVPRDTGEPVLYAGDRTVQRLNKGHGSGYVLGIIPGDIDLASEPIWFGRPGLPERVTPEVIRAERELAESAGIKPFSRDQIEAARRDAVEAEDLAALLRGTAADLVLKYAPDEKHLADSWRLPTAGSKRSR